MTARDVLVKARARLEKQGGHSRAGAFDAQGRCCTIVAIGDEAPRVDSRAYYAALAAVRAALGGKSIVDAQNALEPEALYAAFDRAIASLTPGGAP